MKTKPVRFTWGRLLGDERWDKEEAVRRAIRKERRLAGYVGTQGSIDVMEEKWDAKLIWSNDRSRLNGIEFKDEKTATLFWLKVNEKTQV